MMTYCNHQREQEAPLINQTENKIMTAYKYIVKSIVAKSEVLERAKNFKKQFPANSSKENLERAKYMTHSFTNKREAMKAVRNFPKSSNIESSELVLA